MSLIMKDSKRDRGDTYNDTLILCTHYINGYENFLIKFLYIACRSRNMQK